MVAPLPRPSPTRRFLRVRELPIAVRVQAVATWPAMRVLSFLEWRLCEALWGVSVHNREVLDIVADRPVLFVANHLSVIDSWMIGSALAHHWLREFRWLPWQLADKRNYFDTTLKSAFFWTHMCLAMDRQADTAQKWATMEQCAALLRSGRRMLVFPEGTRSRTGLLAPKLKPGAAAVAKTVPGCVVLPVYHRGIEEILPVGTSWPRFGVPVDVWWGRPLEADDVTEEALVVAMHAELARLEDVALRHRGRKLAIVEDSR